MSFEELFTEIKKCKTNKEVNEILDKYLETIEEEEYFKLSNKGYK